MSHADLVRDDPSFPRENVYGHTKKLRYILAQLDRCRAQQGRGLSVLDFGCGNGSAVSRYVAARAERYVGVDMHEPSLAYARQHFGGPAVEFASRIPPDDVFDVIVYSDVLEHLADPVAMLREHRRHLRPGGAIVAAIPNGYGPFEMEKRLVRALGVTHAVALAGRVRNAIRGRQSAAAGAALPYNSDSGHLQFFTKRSLSETLDRAGFRLEHFRHGSFLGAPCSERFVLRGDRVAAWNTRVADAMPAWAVSTWYFVARPV